MEIKTQRNENDVIMELLQMEIKIVEMNGEEVTVEKLEELYLKYNKLVKDNR